MLAAADCGEKKTESQTNEVKQQPRQMQTQPRQQHQDRQPTTSQRFSGPRQRTYQQPSVQTIYVALHSGQKYHIDRNCRALGNARQAATKQQAIQQGYKPCGICAK